MLRHLLITPDPLDEPLLLAARKMSDRMGAAVYFLGVVRDILTRYPVDGIHLDYVRYPSSAVGYDWASRSEFMRRTGVDPAGNHLSEQMPWRQFARGTDDDLRAVYAYVKSLP